MKKWIDSHLHLTDARIFASARDYILEAEAQGIDYFMQGGVSPDEWERQLLLARAHPQKIGLCFGLHPYFVAENSLEDCERELDHLAREIHKAMALGEAGLDFRPHIMKDSRVRQIQIFEQQLEIAEFAAKPVVFHLVQAHEESLRVLEHFGVPTKKGMIHSFNSSWGKAQDFLKRGLSLSIGGPVCGDNNHKLHEVVRQMPLESLLLESDSPDQAPKAGWGEFDFSAGNRPVSVLRVAEKVAQIRKISSSEILEICASNFRRLFQV